MTEKKEPIREEDTSITESLILDGFIVNGNLLDDFIKALIILRNNIPAFDKGDKEGFDKWRNDLKSKLTEAGVSIEGLAKVTPPGELVSLTPETGEIEFSVDDPDTLTPEKLQDIPYNLLFQWILSGEPAPQKKRRNRHEEIQKRNKAIEKGALYSVANIASYSSKGLWNALNTPSIFRLPDDTTANARLFDQKTGQLNPLMQGSIELMTINKFEIAFLMAINQIVLDTIDFDEDGDGMMNIYLPTFCKDTGLDPRSFSSERQPDEKMSLNEQRFSAILQIIMRWEKYVGRTPDGRYWRIATFQGYDPSSETMTLTAPYLYELAKQKAIGEKSINRLLHGSVVNEPNVAAVELANRILDGLLIRGFVPDRNTYGRSTAKQKETKKITRPDGTKETITTTFKEDQEQDDDPTDADKEKVVTWRAKYSSLIHDCPQFAYELSEIENLAKRKQDKQENQDEQKQLHKRTGKELKSKPAVLYNAKLRNTFNSAINIIMNKSDATAKYVDLTIGPIDPVTHKFRPPTKSTLNQQMIITHHGKPKK